MKIHKVEIKENQSDEIIETSSFEVPKLVQKMRIIETENGVIMGFGGKENDMKLWDVQQQKLIWAAKNVKHDMLDLRVPVWISDFRFVPNQTDPTSKLSVVTGYGQWRMYDTKLHQRRPILNIQVDETPLTAHAISLDGK